MNTVMITGKRESFSVKVLVKKVLETGIGCVFVPWNVKDINTNWRNTSVVVLFVE